MEKTYKEHRAEELQMSLNIKKERDEKRDEIIKGLKTLGLNTDDLYRMLAGAMITEGEMEDDIKFLKGQISEYVFVLTLFSDRDGDLHGAQQKAIQHLANDVGSIPARALAEGLLLEKSAQGSNTVAQRQDQLQKPGWLDHCKKVKQSGANISTLADLTNIAGYNPLALKVAPRTLKTWAKEAGIEFKPGRPKK